jgi:hypothetical protein
MPVEPPAPLLARGKAWLNARDFQIATAITLATAGLLSAWATYQSGLWDKRELEARATANARLTEASELVLRAGQEEAINSAMFLEWIDALAAGQNLRADVLERHFPATFSAAFARWRASQPANMATASAETRLPDFTGPSRTIAHKARALSRQAIAEAEASSKVGGRYDVANVVLATSLFLAGIGTALPSETARWLPLLLAACLTAAAGIAMILTPVIIPDWVGFHIG